MEKDDQLHIIKHEKAFTVEGFVAYPLNAPKLERTTQRRRRLCIMLSVKREGVMILLEREASARVCG